jgi:DNA replication and repair protein RecF
MRIKSLFLRDFRNFKNQKVHLSDRVNFFFGDNGQGKTNLIEAVHIMSRGISFRPVQTSSLVKHDAPVGQIQGVFQRKNLSFEVAITLEGSRKVAMVNGKRATAADLARQFPCVLFSPESLAAIKEGPEQRRQLADELILIENPAQASLLHEYSRALKQRNRLLKAIASGQGQENQNIATLESLNRIFFVLATQLTYARIQALLAIKTDLVNALAMIEGRELGRENVDISVDYLISDESALDWNEQNIYDALQKRLQILALNELRTGSSLVGPHKHDIRFLFSGNDSRFYCSQGQQRALILAFKIAQIVYHSRVHQTYPVLLLDDVLSELDSRKRVNLMKFLESISAQVLITSTDLTWPDQFHADANSIFAVREGQINPSL